MDEKQLQEIEARANAATPGPWWTGHKDCEDMGAAKSYLSEMLDYDENTTIMLVGSGDFPETENAVSVIPAVTGNGPNGVNNSWFISYARTDIPDLVAALRDAWKERDKNAEALALALDELDKIKRGNQ